MFQRIEAKIQKQSSAPSTSKRKADIPTILKDEMTTYDRTSKLEPHLNKLLRALKTIQATSTENAFFRCRPAFVLSVGLV